MYNVDLDELVRINRISDPTKIETGQLILIPRITNTLTVAQSTDKINLSSGEDFIWPLRGRVISRFGARYNDSVNEGLNIEAPFGSDIVAARSGLVSFYGEQLKALGKTIIIDHGDDFLTVYGRNSQVYVKAGDRVTQGQLIAKVGSAGRDKTNFLHFEIRKGHTPKNPYYYLP